MVNDGTAKRAAVRSAVNDRSFDFMRKGVYPVHTCWGYCAKARDGHDKVYDRLNWDGRLYLLLAHKIFINN